MGKRPKWFNGPNRSTWDKLKKRDSNFLRGLDPVQFIKDLGKSKIQSVIKKLVKDFIEDRLTDAKKYWMGFLEWIASLDPVSSNQLPHM